jgi:hypothetical protein
MLVCFVDESGNEDVLTMACAIIQEKDTRSFDREWKHALAEFRVPYLHMRELVPRQGGPYKGWSRNDVDEFVRKMVHVFKGHMAAWCGITVPVKEFYAHIPADRRRRKRNPYFHAFNSCISAVLVYCESFNVTDEIGFMIDGGAVSKLHAAAYFSAFRQLKEAPNSGQLAVMLVGDDEHSFGLQAADLLAYEINKHKSGFERRSYVALCEVPHNVLHWEAKDLIGIADKMNPIAPG